MDIYQQKSKPDYHRLRTMANRIIEPEFRTRNFEAQNGRIESNSLVKNQRTKDAEIVGGGKRQGSFWKETNAVSTTKVISVKMLRYSLLSPK